MSRRSHATPFAIWYPSGEVRRGHGAVRQGAAESADRHRLGEVAEQAADADRGRRLRPRLVLEQTSGAGQPGLGDLGPDGQGGFADRSGDLPIGHQRPIEPRALQLEDMGCAAEDMARDRRARRVSTCPASGSSKPATIRSVVVLPQPEGPSSAHNVPAGTSNEVG